jgi:hypothetical protein
LAAAFGVSIGNGCAQAAQKVIAPAGHEGGRTTATAVGING